MSQLENELSLTRDLLGNTATDQKDLSPTIVSAGWLKTDNTMLTSVNNIPDSPSEGSISELVTVVNKVEGETAIAPQQLTQDNSISYSLTQAQLAARLQKSAGSLDYHRKKKDNDSLRLWTQKHDPDGVGWQYDDQNKIFFPVSE